MNDRQIKMIEKVRKLFALSKSPNLNEASAALNRAYEIIAEYNLNEKDCRDDSKVEKTEVVFVRVDDQVSDAWRRVLANSVSELYFCRFMYAETPVGDVYVFIGQSHNAEVAKLMVSYLFKAVMDQAIFAGAELVPYESDTKLFVESFCEGASETLCRRIRERYSQALRQPTVSGDTKLPVLLGVYHRTRAEIEKFLTENADTFSTEKQSFDADNASGRIAGRKAGDKIGLDTQVAADRPRAMLN